MEWAERIYEGPDGKSYATLIHGGAISLELRDLTVEHLFTPFQLDGENRTPSRDYCTLSGMGVLRNQSIHVVGAPAATASEIPVSIAGYDEEAPKGGGPGWSERARRGWPCSLGAFFDETADGYRWFCTAYISTAFFDRLLNLHHAQRLSALKLNLKIDIFVEALRRYLPDPVTDFYLVPEKGDAKSRLTALGFVEDVDVVETTIALKPLGLNSDAEAAALPDEGGDQDYGKRIEALEGELAEIKAAMDTLKQGPRWKR